MKTKVGRLTLNPWFIMLGALVLLTGCLSGATAIPHDPASPPEKNCTLNVSKALTVSSFDGRQVAWAAGSGDSWASVQVPEGSHTLIVNYNRDVWTKGEEHYRHGITVTYDRFAAGHTYLLVAAEGAESRGFMGMFDDILGTMHDTVNKALRVGIKDVTNEPDWASMSKAVNWQQGVEWLPAK